MSRPTLLHNNLLNTSSNYINLDAATTDISRDPQFLNPAGGDFHFLVNSPCIDAATSADAPAFDKDSVAHPLDGTSNSSVLPCRPAKGLTFFAVTAKQS
jgi:hypothetical protein